MIIKAFLYFLLNEWLLIWVTLISFIFRSGIKFKFICSMAIMNVDIWSQSYSHSHMTTHTHTHTHTHIHTHTLSLSLSLSLALFPSLSFTYLHTHSITLAHTLTHSHKIYMHTHIHSLSWKSNTQITRTLIHISSAIRLQISSQYSKDAMHNRE